MVKSILSLSLFALCISFGFAQSQTIKIKKWAFKTGDYVNSSPAIGSDGTIYVGSDDDNAGNVLLRTGQWGAVPSETSIDNATSATKLEVETGNAIQKVENENQWLVKANNTDVAWFTDDSVSFNVAIKTFI